MGLAVVAGYLKLEFQMKIQTEVVIIGGGATGVGIARDLSLRGIPSLLIEKGDFTSGASGRNHGLLHSGARYAVSDPEAARECAIENRILKKIAPHCLEETGGLFISLPEDGLEFRDLFLTSCDKVGIPTTLLSREEALNLESALNPDLTSAVEVPDGSIDPFSLVIENARDAEMHGAQFLLHTEVFSVQVEKEKIIGVKAKDLLQGQEYFIDTHYLINATGAWANQFLNLAGLRLDMALSRGSMLITNQRLNQRVINRCRRPSDGDIIVPNHTVSILGTTSIRSEDVENFKITPSEVSLLIWETSKLVPAVRESRLIRAYAGIRPLFQSEGSGDDRAISRGFALIDHGVRDGLQNFITITGGKLVTYRLMAEKTSDLICQKMGIDLPCSTHLKPLPGAGERTSLAKQLRKISQPISNDTGEIICDCELVPRDEAENILRGGKMKTFQDILHRTRLAKGTCQGGFCAYRLLGILHDLKMAGEDSNRLLRGFLEERWNGIRPILWGISLKEEELIESIYKGIFNLEP
jgi:glycerol-3-phosphate dehydrogenase